MSRAKKKKIAVLDCETDPFLYGRIPEPFCIEFYTDGEMFQTWGNNCVAEMADYLEALPDEYLIYAHNGGKFDFHFFHKYIDNPIKIINARIVSAGMFQHTFRDSFAILPMPLRDYEKEDFDYSKLEKNKRDKNKSAILNYLHSDCINLFKLVSAFVDRFGAKLTVGSTAMKEIQKRHTFKRFNGQQDAFFRQFYYGGRVECFKGGILPGKPSWKSYDVNSSYPKSMRDYKHPHNGAFHRCREMPDNFDNPFFIHFTGQNAGALPIHNKEGLTFHQEYGEFFACSHEIEVALKYGLIRIDEIHSCHIAMQTIQFDTFVNDFYVEKVAAKISGDLLSEIFSKFMLNSGYGKFAQNPANFLDWKLVRDYGHDLELRAEGYELKSEFPDFELWAKPTEITDTSYFDVSIAASITSASRAILLEGIQNAVEPIYCDTDSLICREFKGNISSTELGAWKFERENKFAAIAGKKMYSVYDSEKDILNNRIKKAKGKLVSKGGQIELKDLLKMCRGGSHTHHNAAPTFSLIKPTVFISRKFVQTIDSDAEKDENPDIAE